MTRRETPRGSRKLLLSHPRTGRSFRHGICCFGATMLLCALAACAAQFPPEVARDIAIADKSPALDEAINAVERIGHAGTPGVEALIKLLGTKRAQVRLAVVIDLGRLLNRLSAPPPAENMAGPDAGTPKTDLTQADKQKLIDKIVRALMPVLSYDKEWTIRRVTVAVVGQVKSADVNESLISALDDQHAAVRQQAATALADRGPELDPLLIEILDGGESGERLKYALALCAKRKITAAVAPAISLCDNENWEVRSQAMLLLAELKIDSDQAIAVLKSHLNDSEPRAAFYAARALIAIGRPDGLDAAVKRFPDKDLIQDFEKIERKEPTEDPSQYVAPEYSPGSPPAGGEPS